MIIDDHQAQEEDQAALERAAIRILRSVGFYDDPMPSGQTAYNMIRRALAQAQESER